MLFLPPTSGYDDNVGERAIVRASQSGVQRQPDEHYLIHIELITYITCESDFLLKS